MTTLGIYFTIGHLPGLVGSGLNNIDMPIHRSHRKNHSYKSQIYTKKLLVLTVSFQITVSFLTLYLSAFLCIGTIFPSLPISRESFPEAKRQMESFHEWFDQRLVATLYHADRNFIPTLDFVYDYHKYKANTFYLYTLGRPPFARGKVLRKLCTIVFEFFNFVSDFLIFIVIFLFFSKEGVRDFFEYFTPRPFEEIRV